jgi:glycosyltransferase involved in cell wall biosynthesis
VEAKGYDVLLEALAGLDVPGLRVLFAGDGPERARLEALARDLGVESRVRFLGFRSDVPRLLATVDLVAMPSRWEGNSIALLEAMAAGRACLVSDIPELVEGAGDAARRVAAGDARAWAGALGALLADPEQRRALGRAAREAAARFSIEASARRYVDLYEEVLGRRGGAG